MSQLVITVKNILDEYLITFKHLNNFLWHVFVVVDGHFTCKHKCYKCVHILRSSTKGLAGVVFC